MVMLNHFWLGASTNGAVESAVYTFIENGWAGVDLFFVLSGFLITGILLDAKGKEGYFRNFYARRALRIFPLYYAFLFIWFILAPRIFTLDPHGPFRAGSETQPWFWTYTSNYLSLIKGVTVPHGLNHFWTLAIEEQFYLVWPAVVLLVSKRSLRTVCVFLFAAGFCVRLWLLGADFPTTAAYVLTPARMGTLAVGAWLAVAIRDASLRRLLENIALKVMLVAIAVLAAINLPDLRMRGSEFSMQTLGFPMLALIAGAALIMSLDPRYRLRRYGRLLRSRILRFFGKYSYAMYVLHLPVVVAFEATGFTIAGVARNGSGHILAAIQFSLVSLAATTLLALLSWHLYEKQFLKLKSRFQ